MSRVLLIASLLFIGWNGNAQASSISQCTFLTRILSVKHKKAGKKITAAVTFHILKKVHIPMAIGGCSGTEGLLGMRQSATLTSNSTSMYYNGIKAMKVGDIGHLRRTEVYGSPIPGKVTKPEYSWAGWKLVKINPKALKAMMKPSVSKQEVSKRLKRAETLTAKGKAVAYRSPRPLKTSDLYVTCKPRGNAKLPVYCMFTAHIPNQDGRFMIVMMFSRELYKGMTLKSLRKHFSYLSLEATPLTSLQLHGWVVQHNRVNKVIRRPKLGKEIKLLRLEKGILYGEATAMMWRKTQLHSSTSPCAPFASFKTLKSTCLVKSSRRIRVKLKFALPLQDAFLRCKKNPKATRCR